MFSSLNDDDSLIKMIAHDAYDKEAKKVSKYKTHLIDEALTISIELDDHLLLLEKLLPSTINDTKNQTWYQK
jgi:hypothetical protein